MTRTKTEVVHFPRPFTLSGMDEPCPAGAYEVQTDEETLNGLSFLAWRRVATNVLVRANGAIQVFRVEPAELEALSSNDGPTSGRSNDNSKRA